jgi:hypothetical protein
VWHNGLSPETIRDEFPGVELNAIYAIIAFYLHNQGEVDAYIARLDAVAEVDYQAWLAGPRVDYQAWLAGPRSDASRRVCEAKNHFQEVHRR